MDNHLLEKKLSKIINKNKKTLKFTAAGAISSGLLFPASITASFFTLVNGNQVASKVLMLSSLFFGISSIFASSAFFKAYEKNKRDEKILKIISTDYSAEDYFCNNKKDFSRNSKHKNKLNKSDVLNDSTTNEEEPDINI